MPITLAVDFGSTYTKVVAIDLEGEALVGVAQSPTTVADGVMIGLDRALTQLEQRCGLKRDDVGERVASSSAAGGLRMVAIGLVPDLTAEAARRAALGAGAKVMRTFAYEMSRRDGEELAGIDPDMILLSGGTDGGERKTIVKNAQLLAALRPSAPIVVAGNRTAEDDVDEILRAAGLDFTIVENVLPELDRLNVDPARAQIRALFMERITHAKGLDRAQTYVGRIVMPTPMAVLEGARLLSDSGLGDVVVADVGGATTDVHSIGTGAPSLPGLVPRGLPEPFAKRTVEGDLGIRINAQTIVDSVGVDRVFVELAGSLPVDEIRVRVRRLGAQVDRVPQDAGDHDLDAALASLAVDAALERHAGQVTISHTPAGPVQLLHGKDLSSVSTLIGTGGVFAFGRKPRRVLQSACWRRESPSSLRPRAPRLLIDRRYILFAAGLLAQSAPKAASGVMRRYLTEAEDDHDVS